MTGAELAQAAAIKGAPVHVIVRELWAERRAAMVTPAAKYWATRSYDARCTLIAHCTTRENIENAAAMPWSAFTDDERVRMGAMAREMERQFSGAACLR